MAKFSVDTDKQVETAIRKILAPNRTLEELETKIDEVSGRLEADPKNRDLARELSMLLADHGDHINRALFS